MRSATRLTGAVLLSCLSLAVAGCGNEEPGAGSEPSSPAATTTAGTPTESIPTVTRTPTIPPSADPGGEPGFPMTVTRTGGIIGFSDALTIRADGMTTVSVKGRSGQCQVDTSLLSTITGAAAKVDWKGLPGKPPTPRFPDDLVLAVSAGGGHIRLDDPRVKALSSPLNKLLGDVDTAPAQRKLCT
jgi:hypothetical protein